MADINIVHSLTRARDFQDRPELSRLCKWWRDEAGVCALIGIGGAGKTALVDRFMRLVPGGTADRTVGQDASLPRPAHLFVFSFYVDPQPEVFVTRLHDWIWTILGSPPPVSDRPTKITYPSVLQLMHRISGRTLLVLDGTERIQDDGLRGGTLGQIQDGGLRELVVRVANGDFPNIAVIATTRFVLDDLDYRQLPNYVPIPVDHLPLDACVSLLEERGVRGSRSQLAAIAEQCGRHALTIDLAGGFISYFGGGDPHTPLSLSDLRVPDHPPAISRNERHRLQYVAEQNQRFSRIAARYREAFKERDPDALAVLEYVCLFRRGAVEPLVERHFTHHGRRRKQVAWVRDEAVFVEIAEERLDSTDLRIKLDLLLDMRLIDANPSLLAEPSPDDVRQVDLLRRLSALYRPEPVPRPRRRITPDRASRGRRADNPDQVPRPERPAHPSANRVRLFTVHPAVRDGFLLGYRADRARQGHLALIPELESFLDHRPGGEISLDQDTLNILEEIIYHALESGFTRLAFNVYRREMGGFITLGWRYGEIERGNRVLRAIAGGHSPRTAPQLDDLKADDEKALFLDWAKFLLPLGALPDVVACTTRVRRVAAAHDDPNAECRAREVEAGAHLLAGRFPAAADAGVAGIGTAAEIQDSWGALAGLKACHGVAGHAESLRSEAHAALVHFDQALRYQRQLDGVDDRVLYGLRGAWYALLMVRLGRLDEAEGEVMANLAISEEVSGVQTFLAFPHLQLVLAEVHLERDRPRSAMEAINTALDIGLRRNAKDILCWAQILAARAALDTVRLDEADGRERTLAQCRTSIAEGLSLAREFGFSAYHVDLLLCQAEYHLVTGDAASAGRAASAALFGLRPGSADVPYWQADPLDASSEARARGVFPPPGSGWPKLYAATHPDADYRWAAVQGFHTLAKASLRAAAGRLGSDTYVPARRHQLPPDVTDLIREGAADLRTAQDICSAMRASDVDIEECSITSSVQRTAEALDGGVLTPYPLSRRLLIFVSYAHEDRDLIRDMKTHLGSLQHEGLVEIWDDQRIAPGHEWKPAITAVVENADIVLLAVSADFLASEFIRDNEMIPALAAHQAGRCRVVPVILRACDWERQPLNDLQAIPEDGRPVDSWKNRDEVWKQIARGVRKVAADLSAGLA
jgi:hypothetical protein